ncbi:MAG: FecR domain-containing protein [Comamonas sp.]
MMKTLNPSDVPQPGADDDALNGLPQAEFEATRWVVREADGLGAPEQAALQAWLRAAEENQAAYERVRSFWDGYDALPGGMVAALRTSVVLERMADEGRPRAPAMAGAMPASAPAFGPVVSGDGGGDGGRARRHAAGATGWRRRSVFAGAAAMLAGAGVVGWNGWRQAVVFRAEYATARGQQREVVLPDGSHVAMDTATALDVTYRRGRREVRLREGQGLFEVSPDRMRPFDVLAGATRITVVGTRFTVRYVPSLGSQAVEVMVAEGRVRVAPADDPARYTEIAAGERVVADAQGRPGVVSRIMPARVGLWRQGRLDFTDAPLGQVLAELGRYGIDDMAADGPAVAALTVTASVDLAVPGDFMRGLPQVLPVRLLSSGGRTVIAMERR